MSKCQNATQPLIRLAAISMFSLSLIACASTPTTSELQKEAQDRGIDNVTFSDSLPMTALDSLVSERIFPKLRSGDKVNVKVFGFEDLTGTYIVNRDGTIIFPLIGSQEVEGLDSLDLQQQLTDSYQNGFIRNPSITVEVETAPLGQIVVDGAVNEPAVIDLEKPMRLSEAIALSGGVNEDADFDNVMIVRSIGDQRFVQTVDLNDLRVLGSEEPMLIPNDFVFVQPDKNRQRYEDFLTLVPALNLAAIIATRN
ncbi:MAG: polysaccharide biosynthesis/export family protein [Pseudomonadota bacterium]